MRVTICVHVCICEWVGLGRCVCTIMWMCRCFCFNYFCNVYVSVNVLVHPHCAQTGSGYPFRRAAWRLYTTFLSKLLAGEWITLPWAWHARCTSQQTASPPIPCITESQLSHFTCKMTCWHCWHKNTSVCQQCTSLPLIVGCQRALNLILQLVGVSLSPLNVNVMHKVILYAPRIDPLPSW